MFIEFSKDAIFVGPMLVHVVANPVFLRHTVGVCLVTHQAKPYFIFRTFSNLILFFSSAILFTAVFLVSKRLLR